MLEIQNFTLQDFEVADFESSLTIWKFPLLPPGEGVVGGTLNYDGKRMEFGTQRFWGSLIMNSVIHLKNYIPAPVLGRNGGVRG